MNKQISIIGVPMYLGVGQRGVDMGPSAMRYANIVERLEGIGHNIVDLGDIEAFNSESVEVGNPCVKYLKEVTAVNTNLGQKVSAIIADKRFPLVLGGDHSIAIGTIAGVAQHYSNLGLLWLDAHADINTDETTTSGNIHGMPLAASLGLGTSELANINGFAPKIQPENVVIIGARSLDSGEKRLVKELGIKVFTMHEIDRMGMARVMDLAILFLRERTNTVHLSFDLDVIDPQEAPGVCVPVRGGITYREAHLAMEMLSDTGLIVSAEFTEVNPILDNKNDTAETAVGLVASSLGEKLL